MRGFLFEGVITSLIWLFVCNLASGKVDYGVNCGDCHGTNRSGFTITGHDTMTDLGAGNLKTFTVEAGQAITLGTSVTDGHNRYAVVLQDFEHGGVEDSSHSLSFTTSSGWADYTGSNPPYYSSSTSTSGHSWSGSTTQRNFIMIVDESTPPDFYRLQFELAGRNGGRWSQREDFYLHVTRGTPTPGDGDIDKDGDVDFRDMALLALDWGLQTCDVNNDFCGGADIDVDGEVGFSDVMELSARWLLKKPLAISVSDGNDDAEESVADSSVSLGSSDLELISDGPGNEQLVGIRFNNVNIGAARYITYAYIQFTVDETDSGVCSLTVRGEASDSAVAFTSASGDISARLTTTASVAWSPPAWDTVGQAGIDQQTPNLAELIEEIAARPGWSSGNSIVFIISGAGERTAESYDGASSAAPVLHILFHEPAGAATAPDPPDAEAAKPKDYSS